MSAAPASNVRRLVPMADIVGGLAVRIESLTRELLPRGRREGHEWSVGSLAGEPGSSMKVHLGGLKSGLWHDWASGAGGDALDLVADVLFRGDKKLAVRWALTWLGYQSGEAPVALKKDVDARAAPGQGDEEEARRRGAAFRMWLSAQAALKGTAAELYLLGRGIDLAELGRQPRALRFHPHLWNERSQRHWPALVAGINRADPGGSRQVAVHRTWLTPDGMKAPIADDAGKSEAKLSYGSYRGGYIPIWRGAGGKSLKDAAAGSAVWLTEGIEDGLSIALLTGGAERVLATVSLSNMGSLALPPAIATVVIAAQNDPWWSDKTERGHGAAKGLDRAIRHFQGEGREVRLWRPPASSHGGAHGAAGEASGKDANDYLRQLASEGGNKCA